MINADASESELRLSGLSPMEAGGIGTGDAAGSLYVDSSYAGSLSSTSPVEGGNALDLYTSIHNSSENPSNTDISTNTISTDTSTTSPQRAENVASKQPLSTPTLQPEPSSLVKTEIRLGSLDVSQSLSRLAEVLKVEQPCKETAGQQNAMADEGFTAGSAGLDQLVADNSNSPSDPSLANQSTGTLHELPQQHQDVLAQLMQLESLLNEYQSLLQPSSSQAGQSVLSLQSTHPTDIAPTVRSDSSSSAQAQAMQLMEELAVAHQISQQQQALIELLTSELQASRNQLAELEQGYMQAKQQVEEKSQRLLEQESACNDLRSRLQRQQHYTLQFKAALEKCLEMAAVNGDGIGLAQHDLDSVIITPQDGATHETANLRSQVFLPKMKPIPPWSSSPTLFGEEPTEEEAIAPQVKPEDRVMREYAQDHAKVVHEHGADGAEWLWFVNESDQPSTTEVIDIAGETLNDAVGRGSSISFDLRRRKVASPESEVASSSSLPTSSLPAAETGVQPLRLPEPDVDPDASAGVTSSTNPLDVDIWEDLARIINAPSAVTIVNSSLLQIRETIAQPTVAEESAPQALSSPSSVLHQPGPEQLPDQSLSTPPMSISEMASEMTSSPEAATRPSIQLPMSSSPKMSVVPDRHSLDSEQLSFMRTAVVTEQAIAPPTPDPQEEQHNTSNTASGYPSPTVYADRPAKKRTSLAAVELPSFPRLRQI